jgi:hypothetical protein
MGKLYNQMFLSRQSFSYIQLFSQISPAKVQQTCCFARCNSSVPFVLKAIRVQSSKRSSLWRSRMLIETKITKYNSPFAGAECFENSTCLREFRSCERRRRYLLGPNYKPSTLTRSCSATKALDKDSSESSALRPNLAKNQQLTKLLRRVETR